MISAIIFDLGGVILDTKSMIELIQKAFRSGDPEKLCEELNIEAIPLYRGEITSSQLKEEIMGKHGKEVVEENIEKLFVIPNFLTAVDEDVKTLIISLKRH